MTTRPYQAAALCWNTAHQHIFDVACDSLSNDNVGTFNDYQYDCFGIRPLDFYNNLVDSGEGVDQCVCKFERADDTSPWTFEGHWGTCNGACVSAYFTCDGQTPVPSDSPSRMQVRDSSSANSSATTAPKNIKALLLVVALIWGQLLF